MQISLNKDKCSAIDAAFTVLKDDISNISAVKIIKDTLENSFINYTFNVSIVNTDIDSQILMMSVYPDMSTVDKIISAVLSNKEDDVIKKIWETNKNWTIEIDSRLIKGEYFEISNKELTAMLIHELGHVVYSNSLPYRISSIFRYEVTKSTFANKALLRGDKIFRSILSLPILDACISDGHKDFKSVKEEIKADNFVKKIGYSKELEDVLTKLIKYSSTHTNGGINNKIKKTTDFSLNTIEDFRLRRDKIAKNNILSLKESCSSPFISGVLDAFIETVFNDQGSMHDGQKLDYMHERADKVIEGEYTTEFFIFGGKQLKKIDNSEIDYIDIKIQGISSESDKLMLASYINSKLDLVDYYISILEDPKMSKRYSIPHSLDGLYQIKKRLLTLRENAIKAKIPERNKNILIKWPSNYEG